MYVKMINICEALKSRYWFHVSTYFTVWEKRVKTFATPSKNTVEKQKGPKKEKEKKKKEALTSKRKNLPQYHQNLYLSLS